jgi:hypothetical protein
MSQNALTIDELKDRYICYRCVREDYLSAEIKSNDHRRKCSYCGHRRAGYSIGEMAERIATVFEEHYVRTPDQPTGWQVSLLSDSESNYDWERKGEPVIWAIVNAVDIPERAASDIQQVLEDENFDFDMAKVGEETEFSGDSHYEQKGVSDDRWRAEWYAFERSLKTEARFFSKKAQTLLATVFNSIDKMSSTAGKPLVISVGPGTTIDGFYRARAFQSESRLLEGLCHPDRHLGPPPAREARAGRMSQRNLGVLRSERTGSCYCGSATSSRKLGCNRPLQTNPALAAS